MIRYINMRSQYGVETVDELNSTDFESYKAFRVELRRLIGEYRLAGMDVYSSQRACKDWTNVISL